MHAFRFEKLATHGATLHAMASFTSISPFSVEARDCRLNALGWIRLTLTRFASQRFSARVTEIPDEYGSAEAALESTHVLEVPDDGVGLAGLGVQLLPRRRNE